VKICFLFILLTSRLLWGDWNEEFDANTRLLLEAFPCLETKEYEEAYARFSCYRESLLQDPVFTSVMKESVRKDKILVLKQAEGFVVKKRTDDCINELFVWELSLLMGTPSYILPSFPLEIGNKKVIVQQIEPFVFGRKKTKVPMKPNLKRVSAVTYWKAHLQAYLLGLSDLVGRNIGVNEEGQIRFFDIEGCFNYRNFPARTESSFHAGFVSHSLDWPHYRKRLNKKEARELESFIQSLEGLEEKIGAYQFFRPLSLDGKGFLERLEKVQTFSLQEGKSFCDFYGFLYPKLSPGLDELCEIIEPILGRKVGHGSALMFSSRLGPKHKLSLKQKRALQQWVEQYVD
jgi:hypothetical protein